MLYIISLIFALKHRLWVLVRTASEAVRRTASEAVLTSTHNLCFEQKYENYQIFFPDFFRFLWGSEIFYIFEYVCFRNRVDTFFRREAKQFNGEALLMCSHNLGGFFVENLEIWNINNLVWPFQPLQTVQIQMRWLVTSRLIRIYTFCLSVTDFWLNHLFATMDVSKFRNGRVHFRNRDEMVKYWFI